MAGRRMKHFVGHVMLVFSGLAAAVALAEADGPATPAARRGTPPCPACRPEPDQWTLPRPKLAAEDRPGQSHNGTRHFIGCPCRVGADPDERTDPAMANAEAQSSCCCQQYRACSIRLRPAVTRQCCSLLRPSPEGRQRQSLGGCADTSANIVVLGSLTPVTSDGSTYPRLQLSPSLARTQTSRMRQLAPGLSTYPALEGDIAQCQTIHDKKILLSIGGRGNSLPLASGQDATAFADRVSEFFGPTGRIDPALRPFGSAVPDGFDLSENHTDKQEGHAAHYDTFAATLRSHFAADKSNKDYFLSAAPRCSYPDKSIHPGYLVQSNFVWPRFYDDPECGVDTDGFLEAVKDWSDALRDGVVSMRDSTGFRIWLYIGLSARLDAVSELLGLRVPENLGGVMVTVTSDGGPWALVSELLVLIKQLLRASVLGDLELANGW
ncbi:glycoside hydrolase family 18 protein [Parathielavia hyrcaniae]|uniref:Glycoside hydrolase family 18 protein n=1 Tax=Parathielavia hyrcaniae TaxID=113614 RepID=A0AAN6Q645_9PEZI|nr:glycoside hydrolase family 18 protein [Parathielavia hyrcaniae]